MSNAPRMRPTEEFLCALSPEEALTRLAETPRSVATIDARRAGSHLMLTVKREHRHFWSPHAHVEVLAEAERDPQPLPPPVALADAVLHADDAPAELPTLVRVRYSPSPSIWTGFMLAYLALATIASFAAIFAGVQLTLSQNPWAFWFIPAAAAVALAMWLSSKVGQNLAAEQIDHLRQTMRRVLDVPPDTWHEH